MVYYPRAMHLQGAFEGTESAVAECPVTEKLCNTVLSLPMHPYLDQETVKTVTDQLKQLLQYRKFEECKKMEFSTIYSGLISGKEKLALVGLGYVGMPIAVEFAKHINVIGFDINEKRIDD